MAAAYVSADALSQAAIEDVHDLFNPMLVPRSSDPASQTAGTNIADATSQMQVPPATNDPDAYFSDREDAGAGRTVADGEPGEYEIHSDDERVHDGVDPVPQPRD